MNDEKWWKEYGELHAGEQWCMVYNIPAILAEHTRRIVEAMEGMRKPIPSEVNMTPFPDNLITAFRVEDQGFNKALDEAIKIVNMGI